jgi:S1-C subfamily serine protease
MTGTDSSNSLQAFSASLAGLVAQAAPAVVSVRSHRSAVSGFVWRPGLIVTPDETLTDEGEIAVALPGGETVAATVAGRDPSTDIALLRIERTDLAAVTLASTSIAAGALALVIGADAGAPTVALGVVARAGPAWRSLRGGAIDARIELSAPLRRRSEGGIVSDASGQAIGMAVFAPRRRVLVIPAQTIERVAANLESHGRVARGYLGLGLQRVTIDGSDAAGAIVISVDPRGPAAKAGILQGDVLTSWNGQPLRHVFSLVRSLGPDSVGTTVALGLRRGGEAHEITLTIGERAAA